MSSRQKFKEWWTVYSKRFAASNQAKKLDELMPYNRYAQYSSIEPVWRYLQRLSAILRKAWRLALPYPSAPTHSHTASQLTTHHISAHMPRYSPASASSPRMVARSSSGVNSYTNRTTRRSPTFCVKCGGAEGFVSVALVDEDFLCLVRTYVTYHL